MAYLNDMMQSNFLEYASYVIKERAIPDIKDGLKPVQRRILHSMEEMEDGKFNKVANVVGHCMKYHPHGDASIYESLVVLANRNYFIEPQGNFGNIFTGDPASAARYIECRLTKLARKVLFNSELTDYSPSYDGRNQEPVTFPCKIPTVLLQGADGIAVGMVTKILPHNFTEVLQSQIKILKNEEFDIYPDFLTGGAMDVTDYNDGKGKIKSRAILEFSNDKTIIIRELPYGVTTESLIESVEAAAKKEKIQIQGINDYTTDRVEIEIKLARGVYVAETIKALFAFTDCEVSISTHCLVIKDNRPYECTPKEILIAQTVELREILRRELELALKKAKEELHYKTLEQIFIANRLYKEIEKSQSYDEVKKSLELAFVPFAAELLEPLREEDIEKLLKIQIKKISLYEVEKNQQEMETLRGKIRQNRKDLKEIVPYTIDYLDGLIREFGELYPRRTRIEKFEEVSKKEVSLKTVKVRHHAEKGFIGSGLKEGTLLFEGGEYDQILVFYKNGEFKVIPVAERIFVDQGVLRAQKLDKETVFTVVYRDRESGLAFIKRFSVLQFILNKSYSFVPEGGKLLGFSVEAEGLLRVKYVPKNRQRVNEEEFFFHEQLVKGYAARGNRLSVREVEKVSFHKITEAGPGVVSTLPTEGGEDKGEG